VFKRLRAKFPKRKKPKKRDLQSLGEEVDLLKNNFDRLVDIATKNAVKTSEGFMSVGKLVETIGKLIAVMDERKIFQSVSYTVQVIKIVNSHDARLKVLESSMAAGKSKGRQKKTKAPKPKIPLELGFDIPDKHSGTA
jgi:16S rRNA G1207 methylase RsmC